MPSCCPTTKNCQTTCVPHGWYEFVYTLPILVANVSHSLCILSRVCHTLVTQLSYIVAFSFVVQTEGILNIARSFIIPLLRNTITYNNQVQETRHNNHKTGQHPELSGTVPQSDIEFYWAKLFPASQNLSHNHFVQLLWQIRRNCGLSPIKMVPGARDPQTSSKTLQY